MFIRMAVSRHARNRFLLRIDATSRNPVLDIRDAWDNARLATNDDLSLYHIERESDAQYRVARLPNKPYFLLIARGEWIVTIIDNH